MIRASRFTLVSEADLAPSTVNRDGTAVSARRFTSVPGTFRTWSTRYAMSVSWGRADVVQEDAEVRVLTQLRHCPLRGVAGLPVPPAGRLEEHTSGAVKAVHA
jgi:hypothetical protein